MRYTEGETKVEQMKSEVKVSVIMPVFNASEYLKECLNTVVKQTESDIEIICIDDQSVDDSWDILVSYAEKDNRFVLQKNAKNIGAAGTRNIGLQLAVGKYVMFLDADDVYDLELIEILSNKAGEHESDMCICGYKNFFDKLEIVPDKKANALPFVRGDGVYNIHTLPENIFQVVGLAPQYKIYRREFILENDINFQNLKNSNDVFFNMIAMALSKKIVYIPWVLVYHRVHEGNVTSSRNVYQYEDYKAYRKVYNRLLKTNLLNICYKSYASRCVGSVIYQMKFVSEKDKEAFQSFWRNEGFENVGLKKCRRTDFLTNDQYEFYKSIMKLDDNDEISVDDNDFALIFSGSEKYIFPYNLFNKDDKVLIYGASNVGKQLYKQAKKVGYVNLVGIVDKNDGNCEDDIKVLSIETIKKLAYDYILIAVVDEMEAGEIRDYLESEGISPEFIKWDGWIYEEKMFFHNNYIPMLEHVIPIG